MNELGIARASVDDAGAVLAMRDGLAQWMVDRGIEQWHPGEMPLSYVEQWIRTGEVYLASSGRATVASVTILWDVDWIWGSQAEPAGYVHQLMVGRAYTGRGIGGALLTWAEARIAASGRAKARLDCVLSNRRLRDYYERAGYGLVGYRDFPGLPAVSETALYEKAVDPVDLDAARSS